jgi:uncharacterized protein (DUF58 family)
MLLLLFGLVLVLVGIFLTQPVIFVSVPITCLIGFVLLQLKRPELPNLELKRTLERVQINEGEAFRVRLAVTNAGKNDFPLLQITDLIPSELRGDNTRNSFSISLRAGDSKNLLYELQGNLFGEYSIGPVHISAQDLAGLIEVSAQVDLTSKLIVYPTTAGKLSGFTIGPKTTRPRPGEIRSRRMGAGMDFLTTRQLLPGEYVKRINWKASARMPYEDTLLSNEFTTQDVAETLIILDCRSDLSNIKERVNSITAYSVRAAMSVAERLLRDKNRVGLFALGAMSEKVSPSYGRRQYDRIALTLTKFTPGSKFLGEKVSDAIRYFYPKVSQVVLISPLMDDEGLDTAMDLARSSTTFDLMIVSPDPLDFPLDRNPSIKLKKSKEGRIALKLAQLERMMMLKQLEAAGTIVLDWRVSESLEQVVASHRQSVAKRIAQLANR